VGLQGTLDTFSLAEILGLLEQARQTGALGVAGPDGHGTLYVTAGRFCAGEAADYSGPVDTREELEVRLIDVCFHLFRFSNGSFEFVPNRTPSWPADRGADIAPVVGRVERILRDWHDTEVFIPSFDIQFELNDDNDDETVTLNRSSLKVLALLEGGKSVRAIARELKCSVIEIAPTVRDLVEQGTVRAAGSTASKERLHRSDYETVADPAQPESDPEPDPAEEAADEAPTPKRGKTRKSAPPPEPELDEVDEVDDEPVVLPSAAIHAVVEPDDPSVEGAHEVVTSVPDPSAELDHDSIERERAQLAARAGLTDPGPVPDNEPEAGPGPAVPAEEEKASITTDRGALLRLFSGLRDQN
jgi:Domain of unknown function (DUF4388)